MNLHFPAGSCSYVHYSNPEVLNSINFSNHESQSMPLRNSSEVVEGEELYFGQPSAQQYGQVAQENLYSSGNVEFLSNEIGLQSLPTEAAADPFSNNGNIGGIWDENTRVHLLSTTSTDAENTQHESNHSK